MLIKNKGAALALLTIVALPVIGFYAKDNEYHHASSDNKHYSRFINDDLFLLTSVADWAKTNHDAAEALSAISSVVVTVGLLIFTGILAFRTTGLYRETAALRQVAKQQRGDLLRSIQASESAAEAAKKAADISEQALTVLERPYLFIDEPIISRDHPVTQMPHEEVRYFFTNYGKTPAIVRFMEADIRIDNSINSSVWEAFNGRIIFGKGERNPLLSSIRGQYRR
jgi:hypothetical protein